MHENVSHACQNGYLAYKLHQYATATTSIARYKETHEAYFLAGYVLVYIVTQTFAVPGPPLLLTILAGAFYPFPIALVLAGSCACVGPYLFFSQFPALGVPVHIQPCAYSLDSR